MSLPHCHGGVAVPSALDIELAVDSGVHSRVFTKLETIYLADNPISQADTYQEMLTTAIPSLT